MEDKLFRSAVRRQQRKDEIKEYFELCMDVINESNLFMLRRACMYISIIYLVMLVIAIVFVPGFKLTWIHFLMVPLMLIQYRVNVFVLKHEPISTDATGILCCTFYFWLTMVFIAVDTVVYSDRQAFFIPMLLLVFPILYIDRTDKYACEEIVVIIVYCIFSYKFKEYILFRRDVYMVLAAYVIAMVLGSLILEMRSREALAMRELKGESLIDNLTHVYNKGALLKKIDNYFLNKQEKDYCAMIVLDLDDFKLVNDNLGHNTGDILLENVGRLLMESFRTYDISGRYGGDEFVVLMPQMSDISILLSRCKALQRLLADINVGNEEPITMSIGAIISHNIWDSNKVFMMADDALYKSKIVGKNNVTIWSVENVDYEKPILLCVNDGRIDGVNRLRMNEGDNYEILVAASDSEALCTISQYRKNIKIIFLEMNETNEFGMLTLTYLKKRESFKNIPILAVVKKQREADMAYEMGADAVVQCDSEDDVFKKEISRLVKDD
ncbi:diguanylate cyclase (GGDEF) domain-containing protein [Pseudobutyrivibrio sp. OR37]|uniref:GGDEF domain-containing protein n=1 Tax=Pseudobutyrivibrio sp. OR37 TaxID=1798186 RepID=UPI0008E25E01|nr:GGDEF domain-containing protein [Pseudobutyrivibrio sp. OR37]SFH86271.1 diguanylate cyclase (GGDEF) domain-containing protein [Pseudobutyrivibrio sp. OR37]